MTRRAKIRSTLISSVLIAAVMSACSSSSSSDTAASSTTEATGTSAEPTTGVETTTTTTVATTASSSTTTAQVSLDDLVDVRFVLLDDPETDVSTETPLAAYLDYLKDLSLPGLIGDARLTEIVTRDATTITVFVELPEGSSRDSNGTLVIDEERQLQEILLLQSNPSDSRLITTGSVDGTGAVEIHVSYSALLKIVVDTQDDQAQQVIQIDDLVRPGVTDITDVLSS